MTIKLLITVMATSPIITRVVPVVVGGVVAMGAALQRVILGLARMGRAPSVMPMAPQCHVGNHRCNRNVYQKGSHQQVSICCV